MTAFDLAVIGSGSGLEVSSKSPSRWLRKAILVPSGDQTGNESSAALLVRLVGPLPSAFITYISQSPSRLLTKAI